MPGKNVIKQYIENGYYHIYNRGVDNRTIFEDQEDFQTFLRFIGQYLSPPPKPEDVKASFTLKNKTFIGTPRQNKNYHGQLEMIAFCLMPNHFHFLIKQNSQKAMPKFMQSLLTRYTMYFNKKHGRVGSLFQGIYKAVLVKEDNHLLHLSRYIHRNPLEYTGNLEEAYTSYADYIGKRKNLWIKPDAVLAFFNRPMFPFLVKVNTYRSFVEKSSEDSKEALGNLVIE